MAELLGRAEQSRADDEEWVLKFQREVQPLPGTYISYFTLIISGVWPTGTVIKEVSFITRAQKHQSKIFFFYWDKRC